VFQGGSRFVQIQRSRFAIQVFAYGRLVFPAHHFRQALLSTDPILNSCLQQKF
jgi:hypothetical protein